MRSAQNELLLIVIKDDQTLLGIAPIMKTEGMISFLGSTDLWDMHDFIIENGKEQQFFEAFVQYLNTQNWSQLCLESLIAGSPTLEYLIPELRKIGLNPELLPEDQLMGVQLPGEWEEYLSNLTKKDRHELRRKLRKLERESDYEITQFTKPDDVYSNMDIFLDLMSQSREEKSDFLTPSRGEFFKQMAHSIAAENMLKLFFLSVDNVKIAATFCFDYNNTLYLYNSGHNLEYASLGTGFLLKALCLKMAIAEGKDYYDLLRGSEGYKQHLGATEQILYKLSVTK
tara:strand:+ start:4634 stop:5488 length:855 start_codon:yes stop_codon:yes gene_type:complete